MFSNDTIFGTPDYIEKLTEENFTLNTDNESINNISEIMKILENTDVDELDNVQIKYELDDDIIYMYKLKKDKLLLEYISARNYKKIYTRLEELEVIPKSNLYENTYTRLFKTKTGNEDPAPQSVVFVFPVAVYVVGVHSVFAAVNAGAAVNLGWYFNLKSQVNGYSIKKSYPKIKEYIPNILPFIEMLEEFLYPSEQEEVINYIFSTFTKNIISEVKNKKIMKKLNENIII